MNKNICKTLKVKLATFKYEKAITASTQTRFELEERIKQTKDDLRRENCCVWCQTWLRIFLVILICFCLGIAIRIGGFPPITGDITTGDSSESVSYKNLVDTLLNLEENNDIANQENNLLKERQESKHNSIETQPKKERNTVYVKLDFTNAHRWCRTGKVYLDGELYGKLDTLCQSQLTHEAVFQLDIKENSESIKVVYEEAFCYSRITNDSIVYSQYPKQQNNE